jgi:prophage regulatory protein
VQICALFTRVFKGRFDEMHVMPIAVTTKEQNMTKEYSTSSILRRRQVEELTGLARSTLYDQIKKGLFPSPVRIGSRAVGWRYREIKAWIDSREVAR